MLSKPYLSRKYISAMSRGFVKEGDQEEAPIVPPRAALPEGEINYVTPAGMEALMHEREELEHQYNKEKESETERRRQNMLIDGKLNLLNERISSARILDPAVQPKNEVRFGATVKLENLAGPLKGKSMELTIVGVDEADLKKQKIAFVAPLARAAMGKKEGEEFELKLAEEQRKLKVIKISY